MRRAFRSVVLAVPSVLSLGGVTIGFLALAGLTQPAAAQATNFRQEWDDIKNAIPYLGTQRDPIDFTERAPLVVPPSNDLPPPGQGGSRLGVNDTDEAARRTAMSDPRRPVPLNDPGSAATGANARAYLIEPPSGMRNPDAVASAASADGFHDNVKHKKKATGLAAIIKGGHRHKKADPDAATNTAAQ